MASDQGWLPTRSARCWGVVVGPFGWGTGDEMESDTGSPFVEWHQARAKGGTTASGGDTQILEAGVGERRVDVGTDV